MGPGRAGTRFVTPATDEAQAQILPGCSRPRPLAPVTRKRAADITGIPLNQRDESPEAGAGPAA